MRTSVSSIFFLPKMGQIFGPSPIKISRTFPDIVWKIFHSKIPNNDIECVFYFSNWFEVALFVVINYLYTLNTVLSNQNVWLIEIRNFLNFLFVIYSPNSLGPCASPKVLREKNPLKVTKTDKAFMYGRIQTTTYSFLVECGNNKLVFCTLPECHMLYIYRQQ